MANQEHLDLLKQGVSPWNEWRNDHPEIQPDLSAFNLTELSHANLSHANLSHANLSRSMLAFTNFSGANLQGADAFDATFLRANFDGANLNGTCFSFSNLNEANFTHAIDINKAIINGANFCEANLSNCNLRGANFCECNLSKANLSSADLTGANLSRAILIDTNMRKATLTGCSIFGISVWSVELEGAMQSNLVITSTNEPTITVDNLEVAQIIYLLLNHKKLRDVLNAVTERGVLVLGRFGGGGLEVLQAIAAKLREKNYLPIIFNFERLQGRNYTETIKTLAGLARFIIADLSGPSVPQELYATVPHFKVPFVPILEASKKPYSMVVDILEYPWVVKPLVTFTTTEELLAQVATKVIAPAEEKYEVRQKLLDELFNKT